MTEQATTQDDEQVRQLVKLANRAFKCQRPLFILVQYNHTADKLDFLNDISTRLTSLKINTRRYDPLNNTEHGVCELYRLLRRDAVEQVLSLVVSMPLKPDSDRLQADFLNYINLHRDSIAHDKLHWVLFLRDTEMAAFIRGASDLWSFCHRTFWLERELEKSADMLWQNLDAEPALMALTDEENLEVKAYVKTVKQLVDETADNEDKARLLLDLSRWSKRHNAPQFAIEVGLEGIRLLDGQVCDLLAELENEIGMIQRNIGAYPEALAHLKMGLAISRQLSNKTVESVVLSNISQVHHAQGDYDTALDYLKQFLTITRQLQDKEGEGVILNNISQLYDVKGNLIVALEYAKQAETVQMAIGEKAGLCTTLYNMGHLYWKSNQQKEALSVWQRSYQMAKSMELAQVLTAFEKLAEKVDLPAGLDGWEQLSKKKGSD